MDSIGWIVRLGRQPSERLLTGNSYEKRRISRGDRRSEAWHAECSIRLTVPIRSDSDGATLVPPDPIAVALHEGRCSVRRSSRSLARSLALALTALLALSLAVPPVTAADAGSAPAKGPIRTALANLAV